MAGKGICNKFHYILIIADQPGRHWRMNVFMFTKLRFTVHVKTQ